MKLTPPRLSCTESGRGIVAVSWWSTAFVAVLAIPFALGAKRLEYPLAAVCLASFAIGFVVWIVAFLHAANRTTTGDDIAVSNWVFLAGSAPTVIRRHLLGSAVAMFVLTLAVTAANPFVWLANLLPLGLSALWGARHGTFPPRSVASRSARGASRGRPGK